MTSAIRLAAGLVACMLAACSGLQVERDLEHASHSEQYRTSLGSAVPFNPGRHCTQQGALNSWTPFEFAPATPIVTLPNDVSAAAVCMRIPDGARILRVHSDAQGGMTYHELTIVHPSLQFLTSSHGLLADFENPKLSPGEGFFSGLGLYGNVVLTGNLAEARYVIVYVHPLSLGNAIDVHTGYETIPVPCGPYGHLKVRFQ